MKKIDKISKSVNYNCFRKSIGGFKKDGLVNS